MGIGLKWEQARQLPSSVFAFCRPSTLRRRSLPPSVDPSSSTKPARHQLTIRSLSSGLVAAYWFWLFSLACWLVATAVLRRLGLLCLLQRLQSLELRFLLALSPIWRFLLRLCNGGYQCGCRHGHSRHSGPCRTREVYSHKNGRARRRSPLRESSVDGASPGNALRHSRYGDGLVGGGSSDRGDHTDHRRSDLSCGRDAAGGFRSFDGGGVRALAGKGQTALGNPWRCLAAVCLCARCFLESR